MKEAVSQSDLEEMQSLLTALHASDVTAKLYLGTDIFNKFDLVSGALRHVVNNLMTNEGMGVMLADELLVVVCASHDQLMLDEMPTILFGLG